MIWKDKIDKTSEHDTAQKFILSSHPGFDTLKMHIIVLKLVSALIPDLKLVPSSYPDPYTIKIHIMVRKLVPYFYPNP